MHLYAILRSRPNAFVDPNVAIEAIRIIYLATEARSKVGIKKNFDLNLPAISYRHCICSKEVRQGQKVKNNDRIPCIFVL